jgi:hypothetical protein
MRKRDAVQKLKKILAEWENCMMNTKAAREILERIEKEIGMVPPLKSKPEKIMGYFTHGWDK